MSNGKTKTTKTCAFDGCENTFNVRTWNNKFCSEKCYMLNQKFLQKQQRKNLQKNEKVALCVWCHTPLKRLQKKYCIDKCGQNYRTIQQRTFKIFEGKEIKKQQERLRRLGKFYTFPKPHEQLNALYQLHGEPKK